MLMRKRGKIYRGHKHKGFWSTLIPIAASIAGGLVGGGKDQDQKSTQELIYKQLPDYAEATGAREGIWDKLQQWGDDPSYGGIAPDWGDIWERASNKVRQYYQGSATSPGLLDRVKSSTSGRGVAESPAREDLLVRAGIEEAGMLKDTAQEQAVQEAQFGENARLNWMNSMFGLSQQKPNFITGSNTTVSGGGYQPGVGDMISSIGSSVGSALSKKQEQDWYSSMIDKYRNN